MQFEEEVEHVKRHGKAQEKESA